MKNEDVKRQFGESVRELRKAARLSQEELADLAELDRSYVGCIERGERNQTGGDRVSHPGMYDDVGRVYRCLRLKR